MVLLYFYTARDNCKLFHVSWYKPAEVSVVSSIHTLLQTLSPLLISRPVATRGAPFNIQHLEIITTALTPHLIPQFSSQPAHPSLLPPAPPLHRHRRRRIMALETLTAPLCRPARPCGVTSTGDRNKIHC